MAVFSQWLCLFLLGVCPPARAATVHVSAAGFSPVLLNVLTNEPVVWVADDAGPYTITVWSGVWAPIQLARQGSTGSVTPIFSGSYDYGDNHGHSGMFYVNIPPMVRIISPTNGAVFAAPASFDFQVEARNMDQDKLMGVDLFIGTDHLGGSMNGIFSVPVTNVGAGTYTLTAIAIDYSDGLATNSVTITVQGVGPLMLAISRRLDGQLTLDVVGATPGKSIVLESTANLAGSQTWVSLQTNIASSGSVSFTQPVASGTRFFRAWQLQ